MSNIPIRLPRSQILRLLDGHTVQVPTSVGLLEVAAKADDRWRPMRRIQVPPNMIALLNRLGQPGPDELWTNGDYECMVYYGRADDPNEQMLGRHLSIKRLDRAAVHNWRHFQQIKNEVCGPEFEAVELYPREGRIADNANQYHLWVMPEGVEVPLGFPGGFVCIDPDEVEEFNTNGERGRQEPLQDGLTTGLAMADHQRERGGAMAQIAKAVRGGALRG